jgi:hypothetical protein
VEFVQQPEVLYHHVFDPAGTGSHDRSRRKSLAREAFHALYYLNSPPRTTSSSADFGVFSSKLRSSNPHPHLPSFVRKSSSRDIVHLTSCNNSYSSHSHHPQNNFSPPSSEGKKQQWGTGTGTPRNSFFSDDLDEAERNKLRRLSRISGPVCSIYVLLAQFPNSRI